MGTYTPKLVVIRGNSGSGKSIVAERLQKEASNKTALVGQDNLRRIILSQAQLAMGDDIGLSDQIDLIDQTVDFALSRDYNVVLEGIFRFERFGLMLGNLAVRYPDNHFYYMDVSFEETLRRHTNKPNAHEFGEAEMRQWYESYDVTNFHSEVVIPESCSIEQTVGVIRQTSGI